MKKIVWIIIGIVMFILLNNFFISRNDNLWNGNLQQIQNMNDNILNTNNGIDIENGLNNEDSQTQDLTIDMNQ